MMWF